MREAATKVRHCWKKPSSPFFNANFDAAFDKVSERMGIGIVTRDGNGDVNVALSAPRDKVGSVFLAEYYALNRALRMCKELSL